MDCIGLNEVDLAVVDHVKGEIDVGVDATGGGEGQQASASAVGVGDGGAIEEGISMKFKNRTIDISWLVFNWRGILTSCGIA